MGLAGRVRVPADVAIVHDYLTQRGGAERVVLSMLRAFPDARLYTSVYWPEGTFDEFRNVDIRTMALNRVGLFRRYHRLALPLYARAFSALEVDARVVLCSSSGWAHGVRATGHKVVYCYAPARWLYQSDRYLRRAAVPSRVALAGLKRRLAAWDRAAAASADRYLTLSTAVRERIASTYGIDADVLHPPSVMDADGSQTPIDGITPGFFLCVSRLLAYKNVEEVIEAFAGLTDRRLVIVGRGPDAARLRRSAGPNVQFLATVDDATLRWLYAAARGLVGVAHEDYGLTVLEAASFGTPAVALRGGGYLDTVVEGVTGVFVDEPEPAAIRRAIRCFDDLAWDRDAIRSHAAQFSEAAFVQGLRAAVAELP
jgi:glycosyltransferase involved in cell wall biosynthesis